MKKIKKVLIFLYFPIIYFLCINTNIEYLIGLKDKNIFVSFFFWTIIYLVIIVLFQAILKFIFLNNKFKTWQKLWFFWVIITPIIYLHFAQFIYISLFLEKIINKNSVPILLVLPFLAIFNFIFFWLLWYFHDLIKKFKNSTILLTIYYILIIILYFWLQYMTLLWFGRSLG